MSTSRAEASPGHLRGHAVTTPHQSTTAPLRRGLRDGPSRHMSIRLDLRSCRRFMAACVRRSGLERRSPDARSGGGRHQRRALVPGGALLLKEAIELWPIKASSAGSSKFLLLQPRVSGYRGTWLLLLAVGEAPTESASPEAALVARPPASVPSSTPPLFRASGRPHRSRRSIDALGAGFPPPGDADPRRSSRGC